MRYCCCAGIDPNIGDYKGDTPLHVAVRKQNIDCVTTLIFASPAATGLEVYNHEGYTPVHLAVASNNLAICMMLTEKDMADNVPLFTVADLKKGDSVLHIAVQNRSIHVLSYLLNAKNIDVNIKNSAGQTALHFAKALKGAEDIIRLLLRHNAVDTNGNDDGTKQEDDWESSNSSGSGQSDIEIADPAEVCAQNIK